MGVRTSSGGGKRREGSESAANGRVSKEITKEQDTNPGVKDL
jgi:hypothetical protein